MKRLKKRPETPQLNRVFNFFEKRKCIKNIRKHPKFVYKDGPQLLLVEKSQL